MPPTLVDEEEEDLSWEFEEEEEPAQPTKTLAVSDESFDFVSQAQGDSIRSWMVGDEDFISVDTVMTGPAEEVEEEAEPENLPDWLNELPVDDWEGEEGKKSGQVVWKAGEGDESLKPRPPGSATAPQSEGKARPSARKTAEPKDNTILLVILSVLALLLLLAILYLLFV
jgi:hypothetical protein